MSRRKHSYHHFSDYPLARILGLVLTAGIFVVGYWSIEVTYEIGIYSLAGMAVPCATVLLWGFIKQRDLWFPWACFAMICMVALSLVEKESIWPSVINYAYWLTAMATSFVLIFANSKATLRYQDMKGRDVKLATVDDPVKDDFLAELFSEG